MPDIQGFRKIRRPSRSTPSLRQKENAEAGGGESQPKAGFKRLHGQVKESSANNRQFFFAYLALMVFVQAMVISTTDRMLLLSYEGIKLPIIDLMVPLLGFYWTVPFFVLALHFNFLHNLDSHHYKLMQWRYAFPDAQVPRSRIHAFLFDFAVLERDSQLSRVLRAINTFLCLYLGPVTLALVLWRMTDYQDAGLTTVHTIAFLCNCAIVWQVQRGFKSNTAASPEFPGNDMPYGTMVPPALPPISVFMRYMHRLYKVAIFLVICTVLAEAAFGIAAAKLPSMQFQKLFSMIPTTAHDNLVGRGMELLVPRIYIDPNEVLFEVNDTKLKTLAALAGHTDWVKWFHSTGLGLDLRGRSLRGAQLPRQFLPRVLMEGTQLEGANFQQAQLQGANFWLAELYGADFSGAQLTGANFWFAKLQTASFRGAILEGADFEFAQLNRTSFYGAQLQGADFTQSQPHRADFRFAHLQAANFSSAQLERADFASAQLQGTIFQGAQLLGADFDRALIQGANFDGSQLQGTAGLDMHAPLMGEGPNITSLDPINWAQLEKLATTINEEKMRADYLENLELTKKRKVLELSDLPKANHQLVPVAWADEFCAATIDQKKIGERVAAIRSILQMEDKEGVDRLEGRTEIITEFKHLLCTKPKCQLTRDLLRHQGDLECNIPVPPGRIGAS